MMKKAPTFCSNYIVYPSPIMSGLVLAHLAYFWNLALVLLWLMYELIAIFVV